MAKKMQLTFLLDGGGTMDMTISTPKDGLDAEAVQTAAADMIPVLANGDGAKASTLKGASYITTTEEVIL